MDDRIFWRLIDLVDRDVLGEGEDEEAVESLVNALAKLPPEEIAGFAEHLAQVLYALDGRKYAEQSGESSGSDDAFLYARCFVVAQGEAHYSRVLADPTKMPKTLEEWCEPLLEVPALAHEGATGASADFETTVSYETGSHRAQWET